jgi:hypothetical protein
MRFVVCFMLLLGVVAQSPQPGPTASLDLLRRATNLNPGLQSYTASAVLSATLHVLIPVHKTFNGTVYYLRPRRKIEFENVSGALSRFKDLANSTPSYDTLMTDYTITPVGDNGTASSYSLVPKKSGSRVQKLNVTIDDSQAIVQHAQWLYNGGGRLDFVQTYAPVGAYVLPAKTDIEARFPDYSVDGTLSYSNYKPNATVSPSVFASP